MKEIPEFRGIKNNRTGYTVDYNNKSDRGH